jgi:uncharacterized protein YceH (UPF0502 family)
MHSVLQKGVHAEVEISLRAPTQSSSTRAPVIPLETAQVNKEMGRVLLRRGGETVAAGESAFCESGRGGVLIRAAQVSLLRSLDDG